MFTVQDLFMLGMKKSIPELIPPGEDQLNLGCGNHHIEGAIPLDYPEWDADYDQIPFSDESIDTIHMYHFLEHTKDPIEILIECDRVLKVGGTVNITVPYYSSNLYGADLDHKHSFNENTWRVLFGNPYYNKHKIEWTLTVHANFIMAVEERCLALITQLVKI